MADTYKSCFRDDISVYMEVRFHELSKDAFRHCRHAVMSFDEYIHGLGLDEKRVTFETVEGWIRKTGTGITTNTSAQHVHYIRHFLLYLSGCGYSCAIPRNIRVKDTYVPYLYSDDELTRIFRAADSIENREPPKNKWAYLEMPMLLRLLYCCGMRVGEAVNITVGDIDFNRQTILLRVTKKYKQRLVPISNELADQLYRYCVSMGILQEPAAFVFPGADRNSPLAANSVRNYFKAILKKSGITREGYGKGERGPCLHCLRHTFAVKSFAKNGKEGLNARDAVPFLSTYLGHDSLQETEKYLKYSGDYFSDTVMMFDEFAGGLFPEVKFDA